MKTTQYHLATTSHDYRRCNKFLREAEVEYKRLSFPTVMAERNGGIVGIVSTQPRKDMIAAGPIYVDVDGNTSFVLIRLIEAYENILRAAGVKDYYFSITGQILSIMTRLMGSLEADKLEEVDGYTWFRKAV